MKAWHFAVPPTEKRYLMSVLSGSNVFKGTFEYGNSQRMKGWDLISIRAGNQVLPSLQKVLMDYMSTHNIRWVNEKGKNGEVQNELARMNREDTSQKGPLHNEELKYVSPWRAIGTVNNSHPDGWEYIWNKPGVGVLPFRTNPSTGQLEFLCRIEQCPSYGATPLLTCVTGRADEGENPLTTAIRELREETGYDCQDQSKWTNLGAMRLGKASINAEILFCVDLTGLILGMATPEPGEVSAQNIWIKAGSDMKDFLSKSDCCYLNSCFGKMVASQFGTYGQS